MRSATATRWCGSMFPARELSAPFGIRTTTSGMCSKESGIERRRIFTCSLRSWRISSNLFLTSLLRDTKRFCRIVVSYSKLHRASAHLGELHPAIQLQIRFREFETQRQRHLFEPVLFLS